MPNPLPTAEAGQRRGRVLLIDDDTAVCSAFRKILERRGHTVFEAADGHEGLEVAGRVGPDIIVLDLRLPVLGGLETLSRLAQEKPEIPVIMVSGSGSMKDAIEALKLGAWDYLIKPVSEPSTLIHTVEANLERSRLLQLNQKIRRELDAHHEQIREDEEAGRKIQAMLFPPADWRVGPYRFQHLVIPSLALSGDFVDYFTVGDHFAAFYCADVSGHGVSSALVTVLLRSLVAKYRERQQERGDPLILEPDRVLAQLNKELLQENMGKHLTVFYGVLDLRSRELRYAAGGHYPPALLFSAGAVRELPQAGPAVGLFPFARFRAEHLVLPEVCRLLVFSDGALDAMALAAPEARLERLRGLATAEAVQAFVGEARERSQLPDDFTMLSLTCGDLP